MFCEKCGNEIPDNSKFCAGCGAKVEPVEVSAESVEQVVEPVEVSAEPVEQVVEPESQPAPTKAPEPVPPVAPKAASTQNIQYNDKGNLIKPLSIGAYIGMFILLAIPIVNLIMLLVWSFSDTVNINKKHFAIASLILLLIGILLAIGGVILMLTMGESFYQFYFWQ